jgi:hypothetical protein
MEDGIRLAKRGDDAHFALTWTKMRQADRWTVAKSVPAVGGVFELYWQDERKKLRLLAVESARYGGLRSEIRRWIDPELTQDKGRAAILADHPLFYRYARTDSSDDMADVVWFFRATYFPEAPGVSHSGRFKRIYLTESAPDKVSWSD